MTPCHDVATNKQNNMEEKKITEQESLELITQMIQKTKKEAIDVKLLLTLGYPLAIGMGALGVMYPVANFPHLTTWFASFNLAIIFIVGITILIKHAKKERKENCTVSYTDNVVHGVIRAHIMVNILLAIILLFGTIFTQKEEFVCYLIMFEAVLFSLSIVTIHTILKKGNTSPIAPLATTVTLATSFSNIHSEMPLLTIFCTGAFLIMAMGFILPIHFLVREKNNKQ